jgi:hypothetical protein
MLRIVEADLLLALGDNDPNNVSYLDRETGDVILVQGDLFSPGVEEYVDEEALAADPRYVPVEPISSDEAYRWMEHFASLVAAPDVRDRLVRALNRPRPFRGFKDALLDFPTERQQWFDFEEERQREAATEWLQMNGIAAELISGRELP